MESAVRSTRVEFATIALSLNKKPPLPDHRSVSRATRPDVPPSLVQCPAQQGPDVPHRALSTRNGILGRGDRAAEIAARDDTRLQRLKGGQTGRRNPGTNAVSEPERKSPGSERLDGGDYLDQTACFPRSHRTSLEPPARNGIFCCRDGAPKWAHSARLHEQRLREPETSADMSLKLRRYCERPNLYTTTECGWWRQ